MPAMCAGETAEANKALLLRQGLSLENELEGLTLDLNVLQSREAVLELEQVQPRRDKAAVINLSFTQTPCRV